jgi:hypothetical protein
VRAVLRLALMFISFAPLQKWVASLGVAMIGSAIAFNLDAPAKSMGVGAMFLVVVPALFGGFSLRMASAGSAVHLRPGGHWKIFSGALLATLLLAAAMVLAQWIPYNLGWVHAEGRALGFFTAEGTLHLAIVVWSVISLLWLGTFVGIGSQQLGFGILALVFLGGITGSSWLDNISLPFVTLPGAAALAWITFAIWYLRRPRIRSLLQRELESNYGTEQQQNVTQRAMRWLLDNRSQGRDAAIRAYLLGTPSLKSQVFSSLIGMVMLTPLAVILARGNSSQILADVPLAFFGIQGLTGGSLAVAATRRSRMLWLRAGMDRGSLFGVVERWTLTAAAVALLTVAVPVGALSIWLSPERWHLFIGGMVALTAFSVAMLYAGMALICRKWEVVSISLGVSLLVVLGVLIAYLLPSLGATATRALTATLASLALAAVMRAFARVRWRNVDWRVVRPPALPLRST